jgi:hypothetical protein
MLAATFAVLTLTACHPGPIVNTEPNKVGGTIAGIVRATDGSIALTTRHITVVNTKTGEKFEGTTGPNGGYTIKVPEGTYHIDVEVRDGEMVSKQPDDTQINNGDLDSGRDFEITVRRAAR